MITNAITIYFHEIIHGDLRGMDGEGVLLKEGLIVVGDESLCIFIYPNKHKRIFLCFNKKTK